MNEIRKRSTYANVMSSLAVFLVLGGATAFAATHLGKNSVGTAQLKPGAVTTAKLRSHAVDGSKIADGSITGSDIAPGSITRNDISPGVIVDDKQDVPPGEPRPIDANEFVITLHPGETKDVSPPDIAPFSVTATCESTGAALVVASSAPGSLKSDGVNPPEPFDSVTLLSVPSLPPADGGEGHPPPNMKAQDGQFFAISADEVNITIHDVSVRVNFGPNSDECIVGGIVDRPL